jgi:hypothetical protein
MSIALSETLSSTLAQAAARDAAARQAEALATYRRLVSQSLDGLNEADALTLADAVRLLGLSDRDVNTDHSALLKDKELQKAIKDLTGPAEAARAKLIPLRQQEQQASAALAKIQREVAEQEAHVLALKKQEDKARETRTGCPRLFGGAKG